MGEEVQWGGEVGTVTAFAVDSELFRVAFGGEVGDPRRREVGQRAEWWLPGESVQPILSLFLRANARRTSFSGLSPHR